jgi:hypothetical protein
LVMHLGKRLLSFIKNVLAHLLELGPKIFLATCINRYSLFFNGLIKANPHPGTLFRTPLRSLHFNTHLTGVTA